MYNEQTGQSTMHVIMMEAYLKEHCNTSSDKGTR
jgi:hypothetical protein